jgi:hypothetical protein
VHCAAHITEVSDTVLSIRPVYDLYNASMQTGTGLAWLCFRCKIRLTSYIDIGAGR